jgi:hypothetical protein
MRFEFIVIISAEKFSRRTYQQLPDSEIVHRVIAIELVHERVDHDRHMCWDSRPSSAARRRYAGGQSVFLYLNQAARASFADQPAPTLFFGTS